MITTLAPICRHSDTKQYIAVEDGVCPICAKNEAKRLKEEARWIMLSEKWPERNARYLVAILEEGAYHVEVSRLQIEFGRPVKRTFMTESGEPFTGAVVAWKPMLSYP